MLVNALSVLLHELNGYIRQADSTLDDSARPAIWGNIAQLDHPVVSTSLENQLVLTAVNVEEESALKNRPGSVRETGGEVLYRNPPLHLNVYLLFTANYRNYETALKRLAQVMIFFQGKRKFTLANSPGAVSSPPPFAELSLTMDLLSLSFEEVNHLWGSLGGKQLPFAAYRGRLVVLRDERTLAAGGEIREVEIVGRGAGR